MTPQQVFDCMMNDRCVYIVDVSKVCEKRVVTSIERIGDSIDVFLAGYELRVDIGMLGINRKEAFCAYYQRRISHYNKLLKEIEEK